MAIALVLVNFLSNILLQRSGTPSNGAKGSQDDRNRDARSEYEANNVLAAANASENALVVQAILTSSSYLAHGGLGLFLLGGLVRSFQVH